MSTDTVTAAAATADTAQPWRELGLKEDEYASIREILGRRPTSAELAMYSVMWSEHCSYKSSIVYRRRFPTEAPWVLVGPGEEDLVHAVRGFNRFAPPAIAAVLVGGLVQVWRLDGMAILTTGHGRLVVLSTLAIGLAEFKQKYQVQSTPTFVIMRGDTVEKIVGAQPITEFARVIDKLGS